MAKSMDQVHAEITGDYDEATLRVVGDLIRTLTQEESEVWKNVTDIRNTNVKALASIRSAMVRGTEAQKMRAWVDLQKLITTAATNYAKTAYAPDFNTWKKVTDAVGYLGDSATPEQRQDVAWKTYYSNVNPDSQANLATYDSMLQRFGSQDAAGNLIEPPGVAGYEAADIQRNRTRLLGRLAIERANAEKFDVQQRELKEPAEAYTKWLADTGKQDTDETKREWYLAHGKDIVDRIPSPKVDAFFSDLEKTFDVADPTQMSRLTDLRAERTWAKSLLPEQAQVETEPTWDDIMADWVSQPNVQKWAAEHGLDIGSVEEPTPELLQAIKDGKAPEYRLSKWGTVYKRGPDDMRAVQLADKQIKMRTNERSVLRPDDRSTPVEITLKGSTQSTQMVQGGLLADGRMVAQTADGAWIAGDPSQEPIAWRPIPADQVDLLVRGVELADMGGEPVTYGEPGKTVFGFKQATNFRAIQGNEYGVEYIDEAGNLQFMPDSKIEKVDYTDGAPPQPKAKRARAEWVATNKKRAGLTTEEEQLGDKVDPKAERERKAQIAAAKEKPKPDIAERALDQRADRVEAEAERVTVASPDNATAWRRATQAQSKAADARAEAEATKSPDTQITPLPDKALDERLQPRPTTDKNVQEYTQRARASESLGASQDKSKVGRPAALAPGQQSQAGPEFTRPEADVKDARRATPTLQQATVEGGGSAAEPEPVFDRGAGAVNEQIAAEREARRAYVARRKAEESAARATASGAPSATSKTPDERDTRGEDW